MKEQENHSAGDGGSTINDHRCQRIEQYVLHDKDNPGHREQFDCCHSTQKMKLRRLSELSVSIFMNLAQSIRREPPDSETRTNSSCGVLHFGQPHLIRQLKIRGVKPQQRDRDSVIDVGQSAEPNEQEGDEAGAAVAAVVVTRPRPRSKLRIRTHFRNENEAISARTTKNQG